MLALALALALTLTLTPNPSANPNPNLNPNPNPNPSPGNHTNGRQIVADIFFHDRYLNAIQVRQRAGQGSG